MHLPYISRYKVRLEDNTVVLSPPPTFTLHRRNKCIVDIDESIVKSRFIHACYSNNLTAIVNGKNRKGR